MAAIRKKKPTKNLSESIKSEASRRILVQYPFWKQNNMNMRATELSNILIVNGSWTTEEQSEAALLQAAATWIKSVRSASDIIEGDPPLIEDVRTDSRWPADPA